MNEKHFTCENELASWLRKNRHLDAKILWGFVDGKETWTVTWKQVAE